MIALSANPWLSLVALVFASPPDCRPEDAGRFPDLAMAHVGWRAAYESANVLDGIRPLEHHRQKAWSESCSEQRWRCECWAKLYDARYGYERAGDRYAVTNLLRELRRLIGDDAYRVGRMPYPIGGN